MKKSTMIRSLVLCGLSMLLCISMLAGSTFAWFTDEVQSGNNVIMAGNLDVALEYLKGSDWVDVEGKSDVFNPKALWEPGYTEVVYLKVSNQGNLALKYLLSINIVEEEYGTTKDGKVIKLSDIIQFGIVEDVDAGEFDGDRAAAIAAVDEPMPLSTAFKNNDQYSSRQGKLLAKAEGETEYPSDVVALVVWMPTSVGNEANHNGVDVPKIEFGIKLEATQLTAEKDAFDDQYDADAGFENPPKAEVNVSAGKWIETSTHGDIWMNTSLQFQPNHTYEESLVHPYGLYHADFVVKSDKDIPADSIILPGYYAAYCDTVIDGKWVGLSSDEIIPAGTEIRLIRVLSEALGGDITVNYQDICKFGNDGTGFLCGVSAVDVDGDGIYEAAGATITVELRVYEVGAQGECAQGGGCKHPYSDCELGEDKYLTIGTYSYTVPTAAEAIDSTIVNDVAELKAALANGGNYVLIKDLVLDGNEIITAPAGVKTLLDLNGYTISASANKSGNQELFLVKGDLTVKNGSLNLTAENNQGWNSMATIFDVTAGGVLNLEGVTASVSGTDMNFIVHLNNWGTATLNVNDCDFTASYVAIRAFNSGYDMNNVTVKNTDFHSGRMFWVHNYTTEGKDDSTLNLDIYGNGNTTDNAKPIRFGFDNEIYFDINGNQI